MSANIGQIVAEITANTAGLKKGQIEASKAFSDISTGGVNAGKIVAGAFGIVAAAGVMKLIDKIEDCTQVAIDNKKALMGLESVAKAYGVSVADATKATKDFTQDGLIQMKSATTGMKNILSTGFNVSEAMNLSQALKDIGAFNNVTGDLGQAFEDATKGMRTGSIELIENIGLTQKLSAVMKAAGVDISNGIDLTNNAAQREAFYNMVLKEGEKFKGNAAKLAGDQAASQEKANAAMKEAADAIGNRLLPVYSSLMTVVEGVSRDLTSIYSKKRVDEANEYAVAIKEQQMQFDALVGIYEQLATKTNKSAEEMKLYRDTIDEMKKLYPDYLGNLDMEKGKYEDVAKAIDEVNKKLALKAVYAKKEQELAKVYDDMADKQIKIRETQIKTEQDIAYAKAMGNSRVVVAKFGFAPTSISFEDYRKESQEKIEEYKKDIIGYKNKINEINEKYAPILGGYDAKAEDKAKADAEAKAAAAKKKAEEEAKKKAKEEAKKKAKEEAKKKAKEEAKKKAEAAAAGKKSKKETFSLDVSETTKQKLIEQNNKYKVDLANAKEEEKWRVELENKKAVAIIKATAEAEEKIAAIRKRVESGKLSEKAGRKQAVAINEQLATDIGKLELDSALKINYHIDENASREEAQKAADFFAKQIEEEFKNTDIGKLLAHFAKVDASKSDGSGYEGKEPEYVKKSLDDVTKSFSELAGVLNNDVINAISNIANEAMSIKTGISGFNKAQAATDTLGMLTGGIGIFSSAVSIFQSVGGLFHKSTYNFDEAVKKMLAGIGEKTPELQVEEYKKGIKLKTDIAALNLGTGKESYDTLSNYLNSINMSWREYYETMAALDKIIPQLAEQLGTAAGDFGSAIDSALSSATTSEELKANLYDSIYGTVKSGLINAFLAGEVMKPLLDKLQQTVTIAVADGIMSPEEKAAIQGLLGNVNTEADKFYAALKAVGLNVVDAAGQLNKAADRMDNVNRNLRLADRISTITTQTSTAGITQLAGNSSIVYDFSNANLGGMTEQQVISAVSKANRMASIRKVGV